MRRGDSLRGRPSTGPAAGGEVLVEPNRIGRPWVLSAGESVFKLYDLRHFDPIERQRVLAEAETAVALSDLDGVVATRRVDIADEWLEIEMERLGETVADHLASVAQGSKPALPPEVWARLIEEVARTLGTIHGRGLIHRDVKPANLMFSQAGDRLLVADFSIASRRPRRRDDGEVGDRAGTDRYIAPELFRGRIGPAADQYALGVTAGEILGERASPAAREVLLRATEQDPAERYPTTADFGVALRAATDDRAPRRLSTRMQRVSPAWRQAWGTGAAGFVVAYAGLVALRPPELGWAAGLVVPLLFAAALSVLARLFAGKRRRRSQPRLRFADWPWLPVAIWAALAVVLVPLAEVDRGLYVRATLFFGVGAIWVSASLGSLPRDAGAWAIRIVRRWEEWRERRRGGRLRRWGARALALGGLALFSGLPAVVADLAPGGGGGATPAKRFGPLLAVANLRAQSLSGDGRGLCAHTRIPPAEDVVPCGRWAPLAARRLRDDVAAGGPRFVPGELADVAVTYNVGSERQGAPNWLLRTAGRREYLGTMTRENRAGTISQVAITRRPPSDELLSDQRAYWSYELVFRQGEWAVTSLWACDSDAASERCANLVTRPRRRHADRGTRPPAHPQARRSAYRVPAR